MSSDVETPLASPSVMSRREALRTAGLAAGAAAFATPVVVGVFSTRAAAQSPCDPALESEAVPALILGVSDWNQNCGGSGNWGRYNGQDTTGQLAGGGIVTVQVGLAGTDNQDVHESWYSITSPPGFDCVATFEMGNASDGPVGCVAAGFASTGTSVPLLGNPGDLALPYCIEPGVSDDCPSGAKLFLTALTCCPA